MNEKKSVNIMNPLRKINLRGMIPLILLFMGLMVLGMCTQSKKDRVEKEKAESVRENIPPVHVVTLEMKPQTVRDRISLPGNLAAWVTVEVSAEASGRILKKKINVGDRVVKGAVLAEIDGEKYTNAYRSAKATYDNALSTKKRLEALYQSDLSNKSDLDEVTAQMENARAAMRIASVDLEHTLIRSPDSGIVNKVYVEQGQFTDIGKPVCEIIRIDPIKVRVGIPESDVSAVTNLTTFKVTVDALKDRTFTARKHSLSGTTSSMARVYDLELVMDNPKGELLPDMFVRVEIVKKEIPGALAVPLYAVLTLNGKKVVYVAEKDKAVMREVVTGAQDGWMLEVKRGLAPGDQVITVGQRSVADGQKIHRVRDHEAQENLLK